ncbi:ComEC family competence protein [Caloramator mitchellensis]|uniref:ComEC family competence protein n=1 Tax=Caloramator mitchellensis TaxID=908809 RepID=A0A0R3JTI6_CALMK|nr:DNA internalization-related competence protein ComEC/Rec2 [Caloramator mitchellensis]KRQ86792.1 ComEC family competence protein [Caloramator mitchellensis]
MYLTYLLIFYLFGIALFFEWSIFLLSAAITALFLVIYYKKELFIFAVLFVLLGIITAYSKEKIVENKIHSLEKFYYYEGFINEKYDDYFLLNNTKSDYKIIVLIKEKADINPGDYVTISGKFEDNQIYKNNYYFSKNIFGRVKVDKIEKIKGGNYLISKLIKIKYDTINKLIEIDKKGGAFVAALLFGYTNEFDLETKEKFTQLGISHILAVSGFNLGIIYLFINAVLKKMPFYLRKSISILFCLAWVILSSFEPSIVRAFIMLLLLNVARIIKRQSVSINNLSAAAIIMTLINPYLIYNTGFILSFSATAGILVLSKQVENKLKGLKILKDEVSISVAAFLSTLPIIIYLKGYFSIITIPLNILISPIIFIITILAFAMTFFYILTSLQFLLYPPLMLSRFFVLLIDGLAKFNANIYLKGSFAVLIVLYILIALNLDIIKLKKIKYANLILTIILFISIFAPNNKLSITILNVGQGDSIFIETPNRHSILIDTGPKISDYTAARDRILPYIRKRGYNKINLLIITHTHNDHFGGFEYINGHINVDKILTAAVLKNNIEYVNIIKGDKIIVDGVELNILYPKGYIETDEKNENALIFRLVYKDFSMLLPSDADLDEIKNDYTNYDIIQLPHHGSIASMGIETALKYKFDTAVISVGKNNFGHPSDKLLDYLNKKKIKYYRTDLNGNILISTDGKKYIVKGDYDANQ